MHTRSRSLHIEQRGKGGDDVDIADARRLLEEMTGNRDEIWREVEQYLVPGSELKAEYAYADLWEARSDKT